MIPDEKMIRRLLMEVVTQNFFPMMHRKILEIVKDASKKTSQQTNYMHLTGKLIDPAPINYDLKQEHQQLLTDLTRFTQTIIKVTAEESHKIHANNPQAK